MSNFNYKARAKDGRRVEGQIDAADRRDAMLAVERMGHTPLAVTEVGGAKAAAKAAAAGERKTWWRMEERDRMKAREVSLFTAELSDLLAAGMTLGSALNCLAGHGGGITPSARTAADLRDRIVRGEALSDAVTAHSRSFPELYGNMIRAGEASGALPDVLSRLVVHYERILDMRERIMMALTYPVIVLALGVVTVVIAMVKIVPQFKKVFDGMHMALPLPTRILLGVSHFITYYGIFLLMGLALTTVLFLRYIKTPGGRLWWDGFKLRVPLVKGIIATGVYANFARTLQTLLANGVPVLQAMRITEQTVGNAVISEELRRARERVTDGTTISGPLAAGKVFPSMMTDMMAIGEQTGDMAGALEHVGRRYENELDRNIKIFTTALEPILIVLVALVVGFVAISILTAVFKATSGLGIK
ncbi:MAG: type II secretion system F family protein [Kiritimatiellia bacterium]